MKPNKDKGFLSKDYLDHKKREQRKDSLDIQQFLHPI